MEKIRVFFDTEAKESFDLLKGGKDLFIAQLAIRYFNELFDFPPDHWGRMRREFGKDTFVSDNHCPFEIKGWIEDTTPTRTLHILEFSRRKRHTK